MELFHTFRSTPSHFPIRSEQPLVVEKPQPVVLMKENCRRERHNQSCSDALLARRLQVKGKRRNPGNNLTENLCVLQLFLGCFQIKLFCRGKQLIFPRKTTYFPQQNKLIRDANQLVLETREASPVLDGQMGGKWQGCARMPGQVT